MDSAKITTSTILVVASDSRPHDVESRTSRMARVVIKFIVMAVWVLYVMIWVMTPTKVYATSWWHVIMEKTNTVYFGIQGMAMLMYTVPVLLVAVMGCVYLCLGVRPNLSGSLQHREGNKEFLSWWRRLGLTKGPLGIVSRTEVAFLAMFIILLVFSFINYIHRGLIQIPSPKHDAMKRSLVILESVALWAGLVGNICLAFMFFPVTRGSSILPLFGLTYESSIRYHIWIGHIAMVLFTAHGSLYVLFWAQTSDLTQMLKWDVHGISNVAGEVSLLAGIVMWLTTFPKIRKNMFELFFYTHYLYIIFIVFFMFHLGVYGTCMMLPGLYLFVLDRYLRLLQSQQHVKLISARVLPCEFVELNFAKSPGLTYMPTSSMFLNVPSVSRLQWHPFTICSNSNLEPDRISMLIKCQGTWSRKLQHILSSHPSIEHLPVSVEGPYGPASMHFLKYETLVMVSGGSGITPFISIIRGLMHASSSSWKPKRVLLVSAFKCSADLTLLDVLLPMSSSTSALSSDLNIQIEAYVTREQEPSKSCKAITTIWFKPKDSGAPISATLGPNSWLWLAMIISASFAISLLLIALATDRFIYPVEKNTDQKFSRSLETIIYVLSFCISIVVTTNAAFMWNKRHRAKEDSQIDNNDVAPSPDLELESLPGQTLAQVTRVHYGARPDFKRILNECSGSSIGVLVCGPKVMQREIASVCSSSRNSNVHFESISFNW